MVPELPPLSAGSCSGSSVTCMKASQEAIILVSSTLHLHFNLHSEKEVQVEGSAPLLPC